MHVSLRVSLDGMAGAQRWLGAAAERALFAGDLLAQVQLALRLALTVTRT